MSKAPLNKGSVAVQSLVDFINDVKPYHSKLTSVIEEIQFNDNIGVKIEEKLFTRTKISSTWMYNYFSGGNPLYRTLPAQRLIQPTFLCQTFTAGQDENTDLALVPHAYSKKAFDGPGVNQVFVRRATGRTEPLTESVDYFQSHGSFQFQIKQTTNANGDLDPTWAATNDDGLIATASQNTRSLALDVTNPTSAVRKIKAKLDQVQAAVTTAGGNADVQRELDALYAIVAVPDIPRSYEALLSYISIASPPILLDPQQLEQEFSNLTSPLFFGNYTDIGLRQSGRLSYASVTGQYLRIKNIVPDLEADFEEWTLTAVDAAAPRYRISGSVSGFAGFLTAGEHFSNGKIAFDTEFVSQPPLGATEHFTPSNRIVIRAGAPLETWNIIKVNAIAHDRPVLVSTRYGSIQDLNGVVGSVSLLDQTLPTGTFVLIARASGLTFDMTSTVDPSFAAVVQVGVIFNNLKIGFKIQAGSTPFRQGDRFYIAIENIPARVEELDLGYGYDLDAYDNYNLVYNNTAPADPSYNQKIGFYYDGRFTDYDLTQLNLQVAQAAIDGRKWRIKAKPTGAPVATLKKDGSGPTHSVDLTDATSGTAPDPALSSVPVYSMAGDPNPDPDLLLFYATQFDVQYSDDDFSTITSIGSVTVGNTFESVLHGIRFTLLPGSKPFIAATSDEGAGVPRVEGGDVFSFTVRNPLPTLIEHPVGLVSSAVPRLIMHSDSFYEAPAAKWTVAFTSGTDYIVSALQDGVPLSSATGTISLPGAGPREGLSFKGLGVHFTIVPAGGLGAGDQFTFSTFAEKPSYLVHGSATGYTAPATLGEYYWNGFIGFKLTAPAWHVYMNGVKSQASDIGIQVTRLREDIPSLTYIFMKLPAGYIVTRTDAGVVGFVAGTGTFSDVYLTAILTNVTATEFKLDINAHDYPLWNGQDLVILNPKVIARLPATGEKVVVEKTENGRLGIALTPSVTDMTPLDPITIDQRFIGTETQDIPLSSTSPETAVLRGWLPLLTTAYDSNTSIAEFSDPGTRYAFKSAAGPATIGTLRQQGADLNEPIIFEWDTNFFNTYLPLNAEANLVISSTGWDDKLRAHITESIKFMISGGALSESFLFHDNAVIDLTEGILTTISSSYANSLSVDVSDGPFTGFLPGYANVPYDDIEGYDAGQPPDLYSLLNKTGLSTQEQQDVLDRWNNFLLDNAVPSTAAQWNFVYAALGADPNPNGIADDMGIPAVGLSIDVNTSSTSAASAAIDETTVISAHDEANAHDVHSYGTYGVDTLDELTGFILTTLLPPITGAMLSLVPDGELDLPYDNLITPLTVDIPARIFEVSFNAPAVVLSTLNPTFSIWLPHTAAPVQVSIVEKVSLGRYRFSIPNASKAKILIQ